MNHDDTPTGKVVGLTRASRVTQVASPEVQESQIRQECHQNDWPEPDIRHEPQGTSGKIPFARRPQGRWVLQNMGPGDMLIVSKLDRLGRSLVDILKTIEWLHKKQIRLVVLQFGGLRLDMSNAVGRIIIALLAAVAELERDLISERTRETLQWMKANGTLCRRPGYGRKKVIDYDGQGKRIGSHVEWDETQLRYISEIAERLGKRENVARIAADFWRRNFKDHRGLPWGQVQHTGKGKGRGATYERFRHATRWFHRAKHAGQLPPPYDALARLIPETSRFRVEPRPKRKHPKPQINPRANWTLEDWNRWYALEFPDDGVQSALPPASGPIV
jgi:putative DNA-invertase from lambdoid prophage Rac